MSTQTRMALIVVGSCLMAMGSYSLCRSVAAVDRARTAAALVSAKARATVLDVANDSGADTTVFVSFGADSAITAGDWTFCKGSRLSCSFPLKKASSLAAPTAGRYLNATLSFGGPVACGSTKAELNLNNPNWYDILDVSLVDGYDVPVKIVATPRGADAGAAVTLGPPNGASGNETVMGVYPLGCDICVARQTPPCGMSPGKDGCKAGSQYDPAIPCQWQGPIRGGGGLGVRVVLE